MGSPEPEEMTVDAPNIKQIRPEAGKVVVVSWKGGAESIVDLTDYIEDYVIFTPLRRDQEAFETVSVGEWGWCASWTPDMEIAADTLWRLSLQQGAEWLQQWRTKRNMTQAEAARALGLSLRSWRSYESGMHLLPKTIRLACIGFDTQSRAA